MEGGIALLPTAAYLDGRSATRVKNLLVAYVVTIPAFQYAKDHRGENGHAAKNDERLMDPVNHLRRA